MTTATKTKTKTITREQWLLHAADLIRRDAAKAGVVVPPVAVSCSWPGGASMHKRLGECWPMGASQAGINEVFVNPKLDDSAKVCGVLCHEMAHAVLDCNHGHKAAFVAVAKKMGCEGTPTTMVPPDHITEAWAAILTAKHGPFPHRKVDAEKAGHKKQTARMLKLQCLDCDAVWRMSAKWADQATQCPCCGSDNIGQEESEASDE